MVRPGLATPLLLTEALAIDLTSSKAIAGKELSLFSWCIASSYLFIISQLWLTSHSRRTVVLLDTGTLGTSRQICSPIIGILTVNFSTGTRSSCVQ